MSDITEKIIKANFHWEKNEMIIISINLLIHPYQMERLMQLL